MIQKVTREYLLMTKEKIIENNKNYWNDHADLWFGTTALPQYGAKFVTGEDWHLFGDVSGKMCWKFAAAAVSH